MKPNRIIPIIIIFVAIIVGGIAVYLKLDADDQRMELEAALCDPELSIWIHNPPPPAQGLRATPEPEGWSPVWNDISE